MRKSKIEKMVLKSFDDLYSGSVSIAKKWNKDKAIPITVIEAVSKILIDNASKMDIPELAEFKASYAKTVREVVKVCRLSAKRMDAKSVPKTVLKECIDKVKESFSGSFNE